MKTLMVERDHWLAMIGHAEICLPEECCGMAAGKNGSIYEVIPVENVLHSPIEYRMDPAVQIREMVRIDNEGLDLLAIFHSHPQGPGTPSLRDVRDYFYPESACIILSKKGSEWSGRSFLIHGQDVVEIKLLVLK
jgi:proteasome lid subunit RPN8/RPN11